MFVVGNFLEAVIWVIDTLLQLYVFVIIAAALVSWVSPDPWNPIVRFLRQATEPVFSIFRRILPGFLTGGSGIDFTPLVAMIVVQMVRMAVVRSLARFAHRMQ